MAPLIPRATANGGLPLFAYKAAATPSTLFGVAPAQQALLAGFGGLIGACGSRWAIVGLLAVGIWPGLNGYFMGFAAGAMIFVAIHQLVAMARRFGRIGWFGAGLALSLAVYRLLALVTVG